MGISNKTFRGILGHCYNVAFIALVSIGTSLVAQGQWEDGAYLSASFETEELAACGCDEAGSSTYSDYSSRNTRRRSGPVSRAKQNVAFLHHRETPPGNMGLHFPYQATRLYYYRRPYNDHHVPGHLVESKGSPAESALGEHLGYSNHIFEQAHESAELQFEAGVSEHQEDGLLEYVDWRSHQQQRLNWEASPSYDAGVQRGAQPFQTTSHKPLQKTNRGTDDLQTERLEADQAPVRPTQNLEGFSVRPASSANSQTEFQYYEQE